MKQVWEAFFLWCTLDQEGLSQALAQIPSGQESGCNCSREVYAYQEGTRELGRIYCITCIYIYIHIHLDTILHETEVKFNCFLKWDGTNPLIFDSVEVSSTTCVLFLWGHERYQQTSENDSGHPESKRSEFAAKKLHWTAHPKKCIFLCLKLNSSSHQPKIIYLHIYIYIYVYIVYHLVPLQLWWLGTQQNSFHAGQKWGKRPMMPWRILWRSATTAPWSQRFVSTVIISLTYRIHGTGTLRKTNMSPENWWLEDVFPIEIVHF